MKKKMIKPTESSTEQEIRNFIIYLLGGKREDITTTDKYGVTNELLDDDRFRFNFGASNSGDNVDCYTNNTEIIDLMNTCGLLHNAKLFYLSVWKGNLYLNFSLNDGLHVGDSNFIYNNEYSYPFNYMHSPVNLDIVTDYCVDCSGYGTITIITNIIRAITFAKVEL